MLYQLSYAPIGLTAAAPGPSFMPQRATPSFSGVILSAVEGCPAQSRKRMNLTVGDVAQLVEHLLCM